MPKAFQPPLDLEVGAIDKKVTIMQIVPNDQFVAPPVTEKLKSEILRYGLIENLLLCPAGDGSELYYPIDGKRRVMAIRELMEADLRRNKKPWKGVKLNAKVREDLTPAEAERMAFAMNHSRSQNPFTDVAAIQNAAKRFKVDINSAEGQKAIAKDLGISVTALRKMIKMVNLPEVVTKSLAEGQITQKGVYKLAQLPPQTQKKLIKKLQDGDGLSEKTIDEARHVALKKAVSEADIPEMDLGDLVNSVTNPLTEAIEILDKELASGKKIDPLNIANAINLLRSLQ